MLTTEADGVSSGGSLIRMLSFKKSSTPDSPMRWRNATSSVGTQGIMG